MNTRFIKLTSFAILFLLVSVTITQTIPVFASSYGHPPSLGAGRFPFSDGLTINGNVFDISKFTQKIDTQNLAIGSSSSITLKIFDNRGPTSIKTGLVYLNIHGPVTLASQSDTWIKYDVKQGITVHDPHHLMGKVTASYSTSQPFGYMTFKITPIDKMDKSTIVVGVWDDKNGGIYSTVVDAISFSKIIQ
jgi:hypothetical protein